MYQNLNSNYNILYLEHLIHGLYVYTREFSFRREFFNMILYDTRISMMEVLQFMFSCLWLNTLL
jgi:hypothetical protein